MRIRTACIALGLSALAISSAVAADAPPPPTNCVRHDQIYNWKAINDKLLIVENYRHQKVLLRLIGTCQNMRFLNTIAIKSTPGFGLSCISAGDTVTTRDFGSRGRCAIISVEPYTPGLENKYIKPKTGSGAN